MRKGKKITILGAGNVGASIAYTLSITGLVSEVVLIDINEKKARGEAMDIIPLGQSRQRTRGARRSFVPFYALARKSLMVLTSASASVP